MTGSGPSYLRPTAASSARTKFNRQAPVQTRRDSQRTSNSAGAVATPRQNYMTPRVPQSRPTRDTRQQTMDITDSPPGSNQTTNTFQQVQPTNQVARPSRVSSRRSAEFFNPPTTFPSEPAANEHFRNSDDISDQGSEHDYEEDSAQISENDSTHISEDGSEEQDFTIPATLAPVTTARYPRRQPMTDFSCQCGSVYCSSQELVRHFNLVHQDEVDMEFFNRNDPSREFVRCTHCRKVCKGRRGLSSHACSDPLTNRTPNLSTNRHRTSVQAPTANSRRTNHAHPPNPLAAPSAPSIDPNIISLEELQDMLARNQRGLYLVHHTWRSPIRTIVVRCLTDALSQDAQSAMVSFAGLLLLPGLVQRLRSNRAEESISVAQTLRDIRDQENPGWAVVSRCLRFPPEESAPTTNGTQLESEVVKQIERKVEEGRLSSATHLLSSIIQIRTGQTGLPALSTQEISLQLQDLHPPANARDQLPLAAEDPAGLSVVPEDCLRQFRLLKLSSASGSSGWTNGALKAITLVEDPHSPNGVVEVMQAVSNFYNRVLDGSISPSLMHLWTTGRAVMLPKYDDESTHVGWRPISIGDCLYRHFGRTVLAKVQSDYTAHQLHLTKPLQLGITTPSGCEIGARLAQLCYDLDTPTSEGDDKLSILKIDISNAFPSIPRLDVFSSLQRYLPSLCRTFRMLYNHPSKLYLTSGALVGQCQTGVRQGCPLAMLFFSLGFHPTLEKIHNELDTIRRETASTVPAGALGFADDVVAYVGARGAHRAGNAITRLVQEARLRVKAPKCTILVQPGVRSILERCSSQDAAHGFNITETGMMVLGNPVGTEDYRRTQIQNMMARMVAPITVLDAVHPQHAFMLLTACINARPQYLLRVAEPHLYWRSAELFDQEVDRGIRLITTASLDEVTGILRSLPQDIGGLGIPRHHSHQSEIACTETRAKVTNFLRDHRVVRSDILQFFVPWEDLPDRSEIFARYTTLGLAESSGGTENLPDLPESFLEDLGPHRSQWLAVYNSLMVMGTKDHMMAWFLSSSSKGTGQWLNWRGGADLRGQLSPSEFLENIRLRLLIEPYHLRGDITCPQCDNVSYSCSPLHALDCNRLKPSRTRRHDKVAALLYRLLKTCFNEDKVIKEGALPNGCGTYRADVLWNQGPCTHVLDIAIVDPAAPTYRAEGSFYIPNTAAIVRENAKRRLFGMTQVEHTSFTPFVIEATGRLGPSARNWLETTFGAAHKHHIKMFIKQMSAVIVKWNARMLAAGRIYLLPGG